MNGTRIGTGCAWLLLATAAASCGSGAATPVARAVPGSASCGESVRAAGSDAVFALLTTPVAGTRVGPTFAAAGCANAPDGDLQWRVRDGRGAQVASGTITATCGSGCVGDFAFQVSLGEAPESPAAVTLEVLTASAGDGASIPLAAVPVLATDAAEAAAASAEADSLCDDPDFADRGASLAFLFPTGPSPGSRVSSGFEVTGCANVFEATIQWRLRSSGRRTLAEGFTTATCGSGCVGRFAFGVPFERSGNEPEVAALELYTLSARDGSRQLQVTIPVVLDPGVG